MLTLTNRTHVAVSFTHNRLFRYKSGPEVPIGTMVVEPDLIERWEQPSDMRYIFHLRQGVHWHNKPPVGGRELVAEDVRYSIERFMTVKGNANRSLLREIKEVNVLGKYTGQVDLDAPNVWLLDYLAEASTLPIVAKEVIDTYRTMKKPQAVIGTGPWMPPAPWQRPAARGPRQLADTTSCVRAGAGHESSDARGCGPEVPARKCLVECLSTRADTAYNSHTATLEAV